MRYLALATDYDGTLAHHGQVDEPTLAGLDRLLASGRRLILVTGRRWADLLTVFPHVDRFEWVVAENGAALYRPQTGELKLLADPPPAKFVEELHRRGVGPIEVGEVIVATWEPHQIAVLETIRELGLELHVIFNKGAVMVLPTSMNKAMGLKAVLKEMQLSSHNVVSIGDAENDHALLQFAECGVAVDNALPALKERADLVTRGDHGRGVVELIDLLLEDDLRGVSARLKRHDLQVGHDAAGDNILLPAYGANLLVAGPPGTGKSVLVTALLESLIERRYQSVVIDTEGDYGQLDGTIVLGAAGRPPTNEEVHSALTDPVQNVVVNLLGVAHEERPGYFLNLLPLLQGLRAKSGRPHWIVIGGAHHLLPATWQPGALTVPGELDRFVLTTLDPVLVAPAAIERINRAIAIGPTAGEVLSRIATATEEGPPPASIGPAGRALLWRRDVEPTWQAFEPVVSHFERRRQRRRFAEGELPPEQSFYFRGPENRLKLRAHNLCIFLLMAEGVDDETWRFHLARGEYSRWVRESIQDEELAAEIEAIEAQADAPADQTRAEAKAAIERRYCAASK